MTDIRRPVTVGPSHERRRQSKLRMREGHSAHCVDFVKLSPTRNMTVLVRSTHPRERYRRIAAELMSSTHVHAEQVGFIEPPHSPSHDAQLRMAAGEFCGNATMSLAALTARRSLEDSCTVTLEVSGAPEPIVCHVSRRGADFDCTLPMPLPRSVRPVTVAEFPHVCATRVDYIDALHVVLEAGGRAGEIATAEHKSAAEDLARNLGRAHLVSVVAVLLCYPNPHAEVVADGTGHGTDRDTGSCTVMPLVHIPALNSMLWENSCGSGTASVGLHLSRTRGQRVHATVHHPGGSLNVQAEALREAAHDLVVSGTVRIVAEGKAWVYA